MGGPLKARMESLGEAFETRLRAYVARAGADGIANLHDAMAFAMGADIADPAARGKRIRPLLCLLSAEALGAGAERAMPFALAIELMHNFALVHDDIQDGDTMRRGRDATWVRFGAAHGVNIGDYLLVHVYRALMEEGDLDAATRARLARIVGGALDHTIVGQALEMNYRKRRTFSEEEYLRIAREKTGHYLAAPIQGGAIVAGAEAGTIERIGQMALFLGPMFQIIDDIIDLTEGKGRDAIGSDIREGKRSYLVAHACGRCGEGERERLFDILDAPRDGTDRGMVEEAIAIFGKYDAIGAGRAYCRKLFEEAKRELALLPQELGEMLGEAFEGLAERRK